MSGPPAEMKDLGKSVQGVDNILLGGTDQCMWK